MLGIKAMSRNGGKLARLAQFFLIIRSDVHASPSGQASSCFTYVGSIAVTTENAINTYFMHHGARITLVIDEVAVTCNSIVLIH